MQVFFAFSAAVQVIGVASIAPFIGIVSNQDSIQTNQILHSIYIWGGFESTNSFMIFFAITSIFMILISNGVNALTLWVQFKFSIYLGSTLQSNLFDKFIQRDYLFHKTHNYNRVIATVTIDTPRFIYMVLQPYLLMCSQIFVAAIILLGLLFLDPIIALGSALIISSAYLVTYLIIQSNLNKHGAIITERNAQIQAHLSEAFIGIKDLKLNSLELVYSKKYYELNRKGMSSAAYISLAGDLPRFAIESISFSAILLFAVMLLAKESSSSTIVSVLSIYALAGYRLLPTLQQIYKSISNISANGSVVADLRSELSVATAPPSQSLATPLANAQSITLDGISYQYPNTDKLALNNIQLTFNKGKLNTIAGPSGSGKSTIADILLGLLPPKKGTLKVNGNTVTTTLLPAYQRTIGYVPQQIFILDDSVIANVAFGEEQENIDRERVIIALTQANAIDFVSRLPNGLDSGLGQDGKLLSGGQRQRIGIARALYRNSKILILDEPTSALDIETEYELMLLLNKLKDNILIIVISHRPAAIKLSDKITLLTDGNLIADGDYDQLYFSNENFQSMVDKGFMKK